MICMLSFVQDFLLNFICVSSVIGMVSCMGLSIGKDSSNSEKEKIDRVNEALRTTDLKVKNGESEIFITATNVNVKDNVQTYELTIPNGLSFNALLKQQHILENVLKKKIRLTNNNFKYFLTIEKEKKLKAKYPFEVVKVKNKSELFITIGMTAEKPLTFNMSKLPHCLLAGTTGSGKSRLLKGILCNLIENYTPNELQLIYLDNKGTECGAFKNVQHLIHRTTNIYDTVSYLSELEQEMMRRNRIIESKNKTNIIDYNKVVSESDRLSHIFVVIDELFPFLTLSTKEKNTAYSKLALLLSMSRSSGIHCLLATQRPTGDVIPTLISANCPIQIGLRCRNSQESINVIEESGLEKINIDALGRGIAYSHIKQEFQSFFVTDETIDSICAKHRQKSPVSVPNKEINNYNDFKTKPFYGAKNEVIEGAI